MDLNLVLNLVLNWVLTGILDLVLNWVLTGILDSDSGIRSYLTRLMRATINHFTDSE